MSVAITSAITLIGLYLAYSLSRQQRLRIADRRISCYCQLWAHMAVARPSRLSPEDPVGPLTVDETRLLYDNMTAWYFESGNGMMLTAPTLAMYLEAKRRLAESAAAASGEDDDGWSTGSERRMRELSLLRTQMKSDVAIYGTFERDSLDSEDQTFLRAVWRQSVALGETDVATDFAGSLDPPSVATRAALARVGLNGRAFCARLSVAERSLLRPTHPVAGSG